MSNPIVARRSATKSMALGAVCLTLIIVGVCAWTYASPYLFARSLRAAALNGDRAKLEELVDFPRVREGLKGDLKVILADAMQAEAAKGGGENSPLGAAFAQFAVSIAGLATDSMVDQLVSPAGLEKAFTGEHTAIDVEDGNADPLDKFLPEKKDGTRGDVRGGYLDVNRFRYTVTSDTKDARFDIDMKRRGLVSWQVIRVTPRLSPSLFASADARAEAVATVPAETVELPATDIVRVVGEVNARNANAFLNRAFDLDRIIGIQVTVEPSDDADEKYLTSVDEEDGRLAVWSVDMEMIVPKGSYQWLHGAYVIDGFFIPKNGGTHQGTVSFGLEPVSEGQVRANSKVNIVDKGF